MKYEIKVLEPTDLWYIQNNINPETNKFYHPTKNIPLVQQAEINLNNSGVIIQKGALHWCIGKLTESIQDTRHVIHPSRNKKPVSDETCPPNLSRASQCFNSLI
ncbi:MULTISPECIES: hypothetical protein [unclassified Microcoleus]|uniref:hypothetical protein n=1 Tax=unclassified Microcoleus TaxID=2642155 RepID=UPI002FD6128C